VFLNFLDGVCIGNALYPPSPLWRRRKTADRLDFVLLLAKIDHSHAAVLLRTLRNACWKATQLWHNILAGISSNKRAKEAMQI
jgi:hypothetical protein